MNDVPDSLFDRPDHTTIADVDLFAYWSAALEHAYKRAKAKRTHELKHGGRGKEWSSEGVHAFSAALGRVQAAEMLMPDLRVLWHIGEPEPTEYLTQAWLVEEAGRKDAEAEFRDMTKLGLLAEMEPAA